MSFTYGHVLFAIFCPIRGRNGVKLTKAVSSGQAVVRECEKPPAPARSQECAGMTLSHRENGRGTVAEQSRDSRGTVAGQSREAVGSKVTPVWLTWLDPPAKHCESGHTCLISRGLWEFVGGCAWH